jgi:hypothetical protein
MTTGASVKWMAKRALIGRGYHVLLLIKGADGMLEMVGAVLLAVLPAHTLVAASNTLTLHDLSRAGRTESRPGSSTASPTWRAPGRCGASA